ncbi:MAG TPA: helix-turn-helix domain-containing protein [Symbiobacteriaceae bacterium]|jgi:transcriptional regulator with XRE-family HTH domain
MGMTRGQRLQALRRQKGVDQQEAAAAIGISGPYLSLLERDMKGKKIGHMRDTFERAATYYGVIPEYLLVETPQEYMRAFVGHLGSEVPATFGQRLSLVLKELELRWGDPFSEERVARALGTTVETLADYMKNEVQITDQAAERLSRITGLPVDWLVPPAITAVDKTPEVQRVVEYAIDNGLEAQELKLVIDAWLIARNSKKPSG